VFIFNGDKTIGEEKLNSLYPSTFFRTSQIISNNFIRTVGTGKLWLRVEI